MHNVRLLLFFAVFVMLVAAQNPQRQVCTDAERRQVEKEAVTLRTWDALYHSYRKFRRCEDVDASEGYSESKARVLVDHWDTLPRAAQLLRKDKSFRGFVRVDATMDTADVEKIKQNALHSCPEGLSDLCKELVRTANEAIEENGGSTNPVATVFGKAVPLLRHKTGIPLRLPLQVAGLETEDSLYAVITRVDENTYVVVLGAIPDCQGQHVCSYGTFIGTTRHLNELDQYGLEERRRSAIRLRTGIKGTFYEPSCGAYLSWREGKYHYVIGLKGGSKRDLIATANSAIQAGWKQQ